MKRLLLVLLIATAFESSFAQSNTFPSNGNVGIGTIAPNAKLEVQGNAGTLQFLVQPSSAGHAFAKIASNGNGHAYLNIDASYSSYIDFLSSGISKWQIGRPSGTYDFEIYNSNLSNAAFLIQSATGNIGIGTSSPASKLELKTSSLGTGVLRLSSNSAGSNSLNISMMGTGEVTGGGGRSNVASCLFQRSSDGADLFQLDLTNRQAYFIGGNVGIGTTSPLSQLHLASNNDHAFTISRGDGTFGFRIFRDATAGNFYFQIGKTYNSWETKIKIGEGEGPNTKLLLNPDGGSVGIGINNPLQLLHVAGNIGVGTDASSRAITFYGNNYWHVDNTGSDLRISRGASPGYSELLRFTSEGLAIGTASTQGYKLAVNGDAIFTKVKVKQYPWSDYVFEADYKLPTLKQVEAYIKQNKHLPDVPSEKEVQQNGLDVGDNQAVLLKKIEELTLYIIEQDKKIETITTQNRELLEIKKELEIIKAKLQMK